MIQLKKLMEIQEFALSQKFDVHMTPDEGSDNIDMDITYGGRELQYRAIDDSVVIEDCYFSGNFENFVVQMNLMRVFEKTGYMFYEALGKEV